MSPEIPRRKFLEAASTAGIAALAGCSFQEGNSDADYDDDTPEPPEYIDETFQYFFQNEPGFNQVGGSIPENAEDWQVVHSALENHEDINEWRQMQLNDHHMARLDIKERWEPHVQGHEGSVEQIIQTTQQKYQELKQEQPETHKAITYSTSLVNAVSEVTEQMDSAAADILNNNLAEYVLQEIDIEIPDYKLSTLRATTNLPRGYCENTQGEVTRCTAPRQPEFEGSQKQYNSGLRHPIGLLQYRQNGEQQVRYFEVENNQDWDVVAKPQNSIYRSPLDQETYEDNGTWFPEHHVTALDYQKARQLEKQEILDPGHPDIYLLGALIETVDDTSQGYDYDEDLKTGEEWQIPDGGLEPIVSDSFGESISEYVTNPTNQGRRYLDGTARAIFSALDKHGFGEPIALDGTIQNPEIFHTTEQKRQEIIEDQAYNQVKQRVLN